jgi:DNA polymerase-3 subunit alpha
VASSCGSLVCYLLRITTIDPIPHDLLFERFIDVNRNDMPDIDIDFQDDRRHLVFDYVAEKYGAERVARLGTVNTYQPRSALHEVGGAFEIPKFRTDRVIEVLIERSSGDARALDTLLDTLDSTDAGRELMIDYPEARIATKMEGHPRHAGQHAAGIVITDKPVSHYVAVDNRTGATMCDKKDAEALGLLKIDALGLTQLNVLARTLELAGQPKDRLDNIPLDDQRAFDIINRKQYAGIFQFMGQALQSVARLIRLDNFHDFAAISALARPGPLVSGGAQNWVKRKNGQAPDYPHPLLKPYLEKTLGVVTYQEQIMQIAREVGGMTWEDVTKLRQSMSKSLGKEYFDQFGDRFKAGAHAKGIPMETLEPLWDSLCAFGSWAFNLSHSVAYGMVSYQCCYAKAYWPYEFAAASLDVEGDPDRQIKMLRELAAEGMGYVPVDRELSTDRWQVGIIDGERKLIGPLSNVYGIGPKMVKQIMEAKYGRVGAKMPPRAEKLLAKPETAIDSLTPIGDAFKRVMPDPRVRNIHTEPTPINSITLDDDGEDRLFFCVFEKINLRDLNEEINVAKRGGKRAEGQTRYLNLFLKDDTGTIFGRINADAYIEKGQPIVERGAPGKNLYAVKGRIGASPNFTMMWIDLVRFIGHIRKDLTEAEIGDDR